jgi:hypothetical protein
VLTKRYAAGLRPWFARPFFEGRGWPNNQHVAAGGRAIIQPRGRQSECRRNVADEPREVSIGWDRKGVAEGNRETVSAVIWPPDRLSCLCSRLLNHPVRQEHCRVIPVDSTFAVPVLIDNLAFADRSDQKNGAGRQRIGLRIVTRVAPGRAAARPSRVTVERLGGGLAALIYRARKPTNMVTGDGNYVLPKGMPRGRTRSFARSFLRVTDGRATTMLRRDGVRFSTAWKPSEALPEAL